MAARGQSAPGGVAFHYAAVFPPAAAEWYSRFGMLVTGGILSKEQTAALRPGPKLIAYEWSSGFYPGDAVSAALDWQKQALAHPDWLLTKDPVGGAAAEGGKTAHWYDFGSGELIEARARHLARLLAESGYDGFFFDTPGLEHIPPAAKASFESRHDRADYNALQGLFLKTLRHTLPAAKIIFLNQGYRHADHMLPYAGYDLTESYFTYADPKLGTGFRPWHDPARPWESIKTPLEQLILKPAAKYPLVRFVHLNYAAGAPELTARALRYSHAGVHIFGHTPYLVVPEDWRRETGDVYFHSLGKPLAARYVEEPGGVVWRAYENGVVALNGGSKPARIPAGDLPEPMQGYLFAKPAGTPRG